MSTRGMVRKQVYLTAEQNDRLRRTAKSLRRSEAEVLREALDRHLPGRRRAAAGFEKDSLFRLVGLAASEDGELSSRVDDILYGGGGG